MANVVKRRGREEEFDEKKVYGSVYAACASAHLEEKECEAIAEDVTGKVKELADETDVLPTEDIRELVSGELEERDEELSFFYEKHLPNLKEL